MTKWEYEKLEFIWSEDPKREDHSIQSMGHWTDFEDKNIGEREGLKRMGNEGWELIAIFPRQSFLGWIGRLYYFKRPRISKKLG